MAISAPSLLYRRLAPHLLGVWLGLLVPAPASAQCAAADVKSKETNEWTLRA